MNVIGEETEPPESHCNDNNRRSTAHCSMDELFIHAKILLHYLVLYVLLYTSHPVSILLRVCNEHLFEASDIPRPSEGVERQICWGGGSTLKRANLNMTASSDDSSVGPFPECGYTISVNVSHEVRT